MRVNQFEHLRYLHGLIFVSWIRPLLTVLLVTVWVPSAQYSPAGIQLMVMLDCGSPATEGNDASIPARATGGGEIYYIPSASPSRLAAQKVPAAFPALNSSAPGSALFGWACPLDTPWQFDLRAAALPRAPSAASC